MLNPRQDGRSRQLAEVRIAGGDGQGRRRSRRRPVIEVVHGGEALDKLGEFFRVLKIRWRIDWESVCAWVTMLLALVSADRPKIVSATWRRFESAEMPYSLVDGRRDPLEVEGELNADVSARPGRFELLLDVVGRRRLYRAGRRN